MRWPKRRRQPRLGRAGSANRLPARLNPARAEIELLRKEALHGPDVKLKRIGKDKKDAIVASGVLVTHGQANYLRRLIQPWQIRSFGYYDLLGEIKYSAQFYARTLSNLELYIAEIDPKTKDLNPTEDEEVIGVFDKVKDPGGTSRKGLLGDYGRLMFIAGEALLFVTTNPDSEMEQWEMLSTDELRLLDGNYTRFMAPSLPATQFQPAPDDAYLPVEDDEATAYRLWKRHPRFSMLPDAPMEGVLELCEELVLLTHAVRARARSRLAGSGILFIDDRITTRPNEATPDEDIQEDPFLADLTEAMTLPITDEGTASAVVPLLARVKVPDGMKLSDLVYHLQVVDPTQLYPETGLRIECIRRIAICLDMPAEVLLGLGDLNHWNIWGIDEQSWKYHLQPLAEHLVADLTNAFLSPYLRDVLKRPDWQKFVVYYDAAKVINHPDRSKDFFQAHDRGVIGDEALRDAIGATEDDAPTKEELARIIGMAIKDSSLAWFGEPAPRGGYVEPQPGVVVSGQAQNAGDGSAAPPPVTGDQPDATKSSGASAQKGPPAGPGSEDQNLSAAAAGVGWMVVGQAQLAMLRYREAAGARVRTLARRDDALAEQLRDTANRDVCAVLGRQVVRHANGGRGESEMIRSARPLVLEGLRAIGIKDDTAAMIADTIEADVIRTLYTPGNVAMPQTFAKYVEGLLAART